MKIVNLIHILGATIVIVASLMKILHIGQQYVNANMLITLGIMVAYIGQSLKVRKLERMINRGGTPAS